MSRLPVHVFALIAFFAVARAANGKLESRIVGGVATTIDTQNYHVSFQFKGNHVCGGVILSNTRVLTAAHCTNGKSPASVSIRVGSTNRDFGGKIFKVSGIYPHPNYDARTYDYDVAVLVLESSITFNPSANSIPLFEADHVVAVGTQCTIGGWGVLQGNQFYQQSLRSTIVPKMDDAACIGPYSRTYFTERMTCHGFAEGGTDACQGDSGGALVCDGSLYGLASYGGGCGRPGAPGAYAKFTHLEIHSFIQSFL